MTTRVEINDLEQYATINGVRVSYELLAQLIADTPPGEWYRVERQGTYVHLVRMRRVSVMEDADRRFRAWLDKVIPK